MKLLELIALLLLNPKYKYCVVGNARCLGGTGGEIGPKLETPFFPEISGKIVPILTKPSWHILDPNYSSFYLKCPRKYKKNPMIWTFFWHFDKFAPFPLPNFEENPKFDCTLLCVYYWSLILQSLTHFFKSYGEKTFGGLLDPLW